MNIADNTDLSDAEVIALQAKLLIEAQFKIQEYKHRLSNIHDTIYCIGGPLNDNKLRYNKNQLKVFADIAAYSES